LILSLAKKKTIVFLPTIALAEVLVPVPSKQMALLIAALGERFVLPTFDIHAAAIAADLWVQYKKLPQNLQYADRHILRADSMIIASAKSAGAIEFYTTDEKCRNMASLVMRAKELPAQSEEDMYLRGDIERGEV
jgi:PIN domain